MKTGNGVTTLIKLYSDDIVMPSPDPLATPRPVPTRRQTEYQGIVPMAPRTSKSPDTGTFDCAGVFNRKITRLYEHTHAAVKKFQQYNGLVPMVL